MLHVSHPYLPFFLTIPICLDLLVSNSYLFQPWWFSGVFVQFEKILLYLKRGCCSSGCGLSWEMGGEDEDVTVSSSTDDVTTVACGGEMSNCSVVVVMDTESPVGPQRG